PKINGQEVAEGFFTIYYAYMSAKVQQVIYEHGKQAARELLELDTQVLACIGNAINSGEFVAKRDSWNVITRQMARFLDVKQAGYDLYLCPTTAQKPWEIGGMRLGAIEEIA